MNKFMIDHPLVIIATFLWVGFVCAISFMEAWLKFRAPGITLPLGLGIGRLVFKALNLVEWVLAISIIVTLLLSNDLSVNPRNLFLLIPLIILVIQTWYVLPELDARAEMHIKGWVVPSSNLHFYYVAMEAVKVICLVIYGIFQFK
ncbi:MAG: hypothetical protein ACXVNM_07060 [Bacteroidia bacterium]